MTKHLPAARLICLYTILSVLLIATFTTQTFAASPRIRSNIRLNYDRPFDSRFDHQSAIKLDDIDQPHVAVFQLSLTHNDTITIDAESDEFNTRLRIIDATGRTLAEDDDGGIGHNAHLVVNGNQFDATVIKDLKLELTSQGSWDLGSYSLTITRGQRKLPQGKDKIAADIEYFQRATALAAMSHSQRRQGWVLAGLAYNYSLQSRYEQTKEKSIAAQKLAEESKDGKLLATALKNIGAVAWYEGHPNEAIPLFEESLKLRRQCGDRKGEANSLSNLGLAYQKLGKTDQAIPCFNQALTIYRELKDDRGAGNELCNLGIAHYIMKDYDRAIKFYDDALKMHRESGDRRGEAYDLGNIGVVYAKTGEYHRAIVYYELAIQLRRELGDKRGEQVELFNLAKACVFVGDMKKAVEYKKASDQIKEELSRLN